MAIMQLPKARLETQDGRFVSEQCILPYQILPEILMWGARFFILQGDPRQETEVPVYREGFCTPVIDELVVRELRQVTPELADKVAELVVEVKTGSPTTVAPVTGCLTTDRSDPRLHEHRADGQQASYLVLSEEERAQGFIRPVRQKYKHVKCGVVTTMGRAIAETYARDPKFYNGTYCCGCGTHFSLVNEEGVHQFLWDDGSGQFVGE